MKYYTKDRGGTLQNWSQLPVLFTVNRWR